MFLSLPDYLYIETVFRTIHPDRYLALKYLLNKLTWLSIAVRKDPKNGLRQQRQMECVRRIQALIRGDAV